MEATTQKQFALCLFGVFFLLFVLKAISTLINRPAQCVQGSRGRARLQDHFPVFTPLANYIIKDCSTFCRGRKAPVNILVTSKEVVPFHFTWLKLVLASSFVLEHPWKLHWLHTRMINTAKTFSVICDSLLITHILFHTQTCTNYVLQAHARSHEHILAHWFNKLSSAAQQHPVWLHPPDDAGSSQPYLSASLHCSIWAGL